MEIHYIIQTIIEIIAAAVLIAALFNENKIATLEKKIFRKIKSFWR